MRLAKSILTRRSLGLPAVLLAVFTLTGMAAPAAPAPFAPALVQAPQCEPRTTHHEVRDKDGKLIAIFVVTTMSNCETSWGWIPVGPPK